MDRNDTIEERMLCALRNSKIVDHIMLDAVLDDLSESSIRKLLQVAHKIAFDNNGIYFLTEKGDRVECPNFSTNISMDGDWLSDKIPDVPFDIEQSGNLRKAVEAESAYCCCIVALVLKDASFNSELDDVIKSYDFIEMSGKEGSLGFKELQNSWQDLQSTVVNVCISAAKYRMSNLKKDIEKYLRDGIREDLVAELRSLDIVIKIINREYSSGALSPLRIKSLTKIDVLRLLDDKSIKIEEAINKSKAGTLYKILNLSSEYIDPIKKKNLSRLSESAIDSIYKENPDYVTLVGEKFLLKERWRRRFYKLERLSIRRREILAFCSNEEGYLLPPKL